MTSTVQPGPTKSTSLISHGQLAKYRYTLLYPAMAMAISSHEQPGPAMGTRSSHEKAQQSPARSNHEQPGLPWPESVMACQQSSGNKVLRYPAKSNYGQVQTARSIKQGQVIYKTLSSIASHGQPCTTISN